ncbi:MAG: hypothetical protein HN867_13120 [Deltaproteobacteria bacterium]|nr:hypothetical protein [Deltaproteobacteria bacterium]MBT7204407.1 hypothetical protein [Deltaproteobacteria bacterium]
MISLGLGSPRAYGPRDNVVLQRLFLTTQKVHFTSPVIARDIVTKQSISDFPLKRHSLLGYYPNRNRLPRRLTPPRSDEKLMNRIASPH